MALALLDSFLPANVDERIESYVSEDETFCVYLLADEEITILKHADMSGIPSSKTTGARKSIDPTTG